MVTVNWTAPFPDLMEVTMWKEQGHIIHAHIVGDQGCDGGVTGYCGNQKRSLTQLRGFFEEEEVSKLKDDQEIVTVRREGERLLDRSHCKCKGPGVESMAKWGNCERFNKAETWGVRCAVTAGGEVPCGLHPPKVNIFPRPVKNGAKTRMNFLCTYRQPPSGPGLPAKQMFQELSWQTHGITRLGPYSLDKDSLYVNGERFSAHFTGATF